MREFFVNAWLLFGGALCCGGAVSALAVVVKSVREYWRK